MTASAYWNPKNETLPRDQLHALQLLKLCFKTAQTDSSERSGSTASR